VLDITQDRGTVLHLDARQFEPPEKHTTDLKGAGGKGRHMFAVPWIADAETELRSVSLFIDESINKYITAIIGKTNNTVWNVFQTAHSLASAPESVPKAVKQR
jgi:hypothetical protein